MIGTYALSSGYYEAYYGTAQKVRTRIVEDFRSAFERVDLVITPTSPTVAFKLGEREADPLAMYLSDYYTTPASLAGIPAISIPCGPVRGAAGGPPADRARVQREPHSGRRARPGAGDRLRGGAAPMSEARVYEPVIGIEIHVQLRTRTKMFCGCANEFGAPPNTLTCPDLPGPPGHAAGDQRRGGAPGAHDRDGVRLRGRPSARSSTARTTSIRTARRRYQISQYDFPLARARAPRRRAHPPRAHGGGRRQAGARRRLRAHPRRRAQRRGLQPRAARRWWRS